MTSYRVGETLISEEQLEERIAELAAEISEEYGDSNVLVLGVLKGAIYFMADLTRALSIPFELDFMAVSSYGSSTTSSGVVRILKDLDTSIAGRRVLVVEDIVDSGLTLSYLLKNLASRGPESLDVCTLLAKPDRGHGQTVRFVGFEIPDEFVVGYGLDLAEAYRGLSHIARLEEGAEGTGTGDTK